MSSDDLRCVLCAGSGSSLSFRRLAQWRAHMQRAHGLEEEEIRIMQEWRKDKGEEKKQQMKSSITHQSLFQSVSSISPFVIDLSDDAAPPTNPPQSTHSATHTDAHTLTIESTTPTPTTTTQTATVDTKIEMYQPPSSLPSIQSPPPHTIDSDSTQVHSIPPPVTAANTTDVIQTQTTVAVTPIPANASLPINPANDEPAAPVELPMVPSHESTADQPIDPLASLPTEEAPIIPAGHKLERKRRTPAANRRSSNRRQPEEDGDDSDEGDEDDDPDSQDGPTNISAHAQPFHSHIDAEVDDASMIDSSVASSSSEGVDDDSDDDSVDVDHPTVPSHPHHHGMTHQLSYTPISTSLQKPSASRRRPSTATTAPSPLCHLCRVNNPRETLLCHSSESPGFVLRGRRCTKRFCFACLSTTFGLNPSLLSRSVFCCPACDGTCICSRCKSNYKLARTAAAAAAAASSATPNELKSTHLTPLQSNHTTPLQSTRKESTTKQPPGAPTTKSMQRNHRPHIPNSPVRPTKTTTTRNNNQPLTLNHHPSLTTPFPPFPPSQFPPPPSIPPSLFSPIPNFQPTLAPPAVIMPPPPPLPRPDEFILRVGDVIERCVAHNERHLVLPRLCIDNTFAVCVTMPPSTPTCQPHAATNLTVGDTFPPFSVHFPRAGLPFYLPPGSKYRMTNIDTNLVEIDTTTQVDERDTTTTTTIETEEKRTSLEPNRDEMNTTELRFGLRERPGTASVILFDLYVEPLTAIFPPGAPPPPAALLPTSFPLTGVPSSVPANPHKRSRVESPLAAEDSQMPRPQPNDTVTIDQTNRTHAQQQPQMDTSV